MNDFNKNEDQINNLLSKHNTDFATIMSNDPRDLPRDLVMELSILLKEKKNILYQMALEEKQKMKKLPVVNLKEYRDLNSIIKP